MNYFPALHRRMNASFQVMCLAVVVTMSAGGVLQAQETGTETTPEQVRHGKIERLRAEIANQIQLQAYDLLDELVFGWLEAPPFAIPTSVVLADVTAPFAYGSGLEALIENHLAQLLIKNPKTNVIMAHCPACNALVVHSDAVGTVMGRGVDQPKALKKLRGGSGAEHALFLDFEGEGTALVARVRITRLTALLPIVYARTLSTRLAKAALLRKPDRLLSAQDAREEYESLLEGRGPISIPVRFVLSAFSPSQDAALPFPIPIPWLQIGGEMSMGTARAWTGSLILGATFVPTIHSGAMFQARVHRLLTGSSFSLTRPDIYGFFGVAVMGIQGATATVLVPPSQTSAVLDLVGILGSMALYPSVQAGLELRVNNRIGASFFFESMPTLQDNDNIGNWLDSLDTGIDFGPLQINSMGVEVTFTF
ncbi:MAG: hypothetical protein GY822_11445 [Deltaproteobacteria bacterium]|nr:hypothetical protein [Deltaproteobacteria bacterium]